MNYSNGKLGCKENLTYKKLENLIKEASRKLNKRNIFKFYPTSSFNNNTIIKETTQKHTKENTCNTQSHMQMNKLI